ncbi:hypothetical protein ACFRCW_42325 [Streptomyces sp. NPDC056653]|uniref:hypothetical protein n=1 Tax=Streptomyces sp. NPDC056653 TaxID=3345894 RepID=UPI003678517E
MSSQGWDQADYHCGRCGFTGSATTEGAYVYLVTSHQQAHDLWDYLTPAQQEQLRRVITGPVSCDHTGPGTPCDWDVCRATPPDDGSHIVDMLRDLDRGN